MLDFIPGKEQIEKHLGASAIPAWKELIGFVETNYDFEPLWGAGGKYGDWEVKYRRSGKTLCAFYVNDGYFTVLIVFGKAEREKFEIAQADFCTAIVELYDNTHQYHDGKWIWVSISDMSLVEDIKKMIAIKKKQRTRK